MTAYPGVRPLLLALTAVWPLAASAAGTTPVTPGIAERVLAQTDGVTEAFRSMLEADGKTDSVDLTTLVDVTSPVWKLFYRDRQLLFAVPTRRNMTAIEKEAGEREARDLAIVLLQQRFSQLLQLAPGDDLDPESVRVVLVDPAAYEMGRGGLGGGGAFGGGFGLGGGLCGVPVGFAPAGYWPATGSALGGGGGGCGCH